MITAGGRGMEAMEDGAHHGLVIMMDSWEEPGCQGSLEGGHINQGTTELVVVRRVTEEAIAVGLSVRRVTVSEIGSKFEFEWIKSTQISDSIY